MDRDLTKQSKAFIERCPHFFKSEEEKETFIKTVNRVASLIDDCVYGWEWECDFDNLPYDGCEYAAENYD